MVRVGNETRGEKKLQNSLIRFATSLHYVPNQANETKLKELVQAEKFDLSRRHNDHTNDLHYDYFDGQFAGCDVCFCDGASCNG